MGEGHGFSASYWDLFYRKNKGLLVCRAREYSQNYHVVEDIVSETMCILISIPLEKFEGASDDRISAYACGIVRNVARGLLAKDSKDKRISLESFAERENRGSRMRTPFVGSVSDCSADRLELALSALPTEYREVLRLRYFCSLSYGEMSKVMRVSVVSARKKVSRAQKLLKVILEDS